MASRFELIVFDWDGTLMDSAAAIVHAIQQAAADLGLPPPSEASARHVIGLGLQDALQQAMPELDSSGYAEVAARYRHHYLAQDQELRLFAGIEALVDELASAERMLAVATGKSRVGLERVLRSSGLGRYFHGTRCADECHSKPHPQMLLELMDEFGVRPEQTLMIGDTTHDLLMASNAGVAAVGVSYGAHTREQLASVPALVCVDDVAGLQRFLRAES